MERISAPRLPDGMDALDWYEETLEKMLAALRAADPVVMVRDLHQTWSFG